MNLSNHNQITWFSKLDTGSRIFKAKISHSHIKSAEKKKKKKRRVRGSREREMSGGETERICFALLLDY